MKKNASFQFFFNSSSEAALIAKSLSPEIKQKIPKTNVKITLSDNTLLLDICSNDVSSLRAACNSYLRWINTALSVKQLI